MYTKLLINMNSNSETFRFPSSLNWSRITLEGCNLVSQQAEDNYIVNISEITEEAIIINNGSGVDKSTTFLVGPQPFNPTEYHTIENGTPDRAINTLTVTIYDTKGVLATINDIFYIQLRIDLPETKC